MEKEQKKKLFKLGLPIIMGTILLLGVSYAWLTLTLNGTKTNVLKAGTLSLILTDEATNGINMQGVVPMLDEVGVTTSPYSFTLTNNGTVESEYTIYLDDVTLDAGETKLPDNVIKYNLVKDGTSQATALLSTIGSNPNRVLDSGVIKPNETYNYDLRLWLDQDATREIAGQVFKGKIRVEASQTGPKEVTPESCFDFNNGTITRYNDKDSEGNACPKDVVIPSTINGEKVIEIGHEEDNVFFDITSIVLPEGLLYIGRSAFSGNDLTNLTIPSSVVMIENSAFYGNQLQKVIFLSSDDGNHLSIGSNAFFDNQLTSITIPNSVTSIDSGAFNNNQLPDDQAIIYKRNSDGTEDKTTIVSYGGAKRDNVIIPEGVTVIEGWAFLGNDLTSITIPESVISIGDYAFMSNQLTSVIIKGKTSSALFDNYGYPIWGWASGYSDDNITWQP